MKKAGILLVLLTACLGLPAREVINLNRDWRFFSYSEGSSDRAQNVNLPHTWNNDALGGKNDYFRGVGNYMKDIQVPLEWRNKRVFIRFSGAGTVTDLIVNGRHVGEHRGGFGAFTFELTGATANRTCCGRSSTTRLGLTCFRRRATSTSTTDCTATSI